MSSEQIYNIFTIPIIKEILSNVKNGNLSTLIQLLLVEQNLNEKDPLKVLNYTRILNRFLPFMFELPEEVQDELLWNDSLEIWGKHVGGQLLATCIHMFINGGIKPKKEWDQESSQKEDAPYRIDLLRFILTCLSKSIYMEIEQVTINPNKFLLSLENDILSKWIPKLIDIANQCSSEAFVPYEYVFKSQSQSILAELCIQNLSILITFLPMEILCNTFERDVLSNLITCLFCSLKSYIDSHKTFLPFSKRADKGLEESLVLLFKLNQMYPVILAFLKSN